MVRRRIGVFLLLLLLVFPLYHDYRIYAVNPESSSAAAIFAVEDTDANAQCPDKSETVEYDTSGSYPTKRVGDCIAPKQAAAVFATERQCVITNMYKKPCTGVQSGKKIIGHCVTEKKCHADKYIDENGKEQEVKEPDLPQTPTQVACTNPSGCVATPTTGATPITPAPTTGATPPPAAQQPTVTAPGSNGTGQGVGTALGGTGVANPGNTGSGAPTQTAPAAGASQTGSSVTGGSVGGGATVPAQTQSPWTGGNNPSYLNPSNQYAPSGAPQDYSGYGSYPSQPTTFGGASYGGSYSSGGGFAGSLASMFGSLFSIPASSVTNFIRTFTGSPSPRPVAVRVQNPTVISRPLDVPEDPDTYKRILAIARDEEYTPSQPSSSSTRTLPEGNVELATPGTVEAPSRVEPVSARISQEYPSPAATDNGPVVEVSMLASTSVETAATGTRATTTPVRAPYAVVVGVPIDITSPIGFLSVLAKMNGDWTHSVSSSLKNKAALAQAESENASTEAQIEALQDVKSAGLCDETCAASLDLLLSQRSIRRSNIERLNARVYADETASDALPPPTLGQMTRVVDTVVVTHTGGKNIPGIGNASGIAGVTYGVPETPGTSHQDPPGTPTTVSVATKELPPEASQTKGEATVLRIVKGIWNIFTSWFKPQAQTPVAPKPTCSLFLSLFGKCK